MDITRTFRKRKSIIPAAVSSNVVCGTRTVHVAEDGSSAAVSGLLDGDRVKVD